MIYICCWYFLLGVGKLLFYNKVVNFPSFFGYLFLHSLYLYFKISISPCSQGWCDTNVSTQWYLSAVLLYFIVGIFMSVYCLSYADLFEQCMLCYIWYGSTHGTSFYLFVIFFAISYGSQVLALSFMNGHATDPIIKIKWSSEFHFCSTWKKEWVSTCYFFCLFPHNFLVNVLMI